ncbi:GDYXXLXY domain-containing protein [Rhizobium sp. BK376]|jgi:uncharacterized membrane-anchored protein|uniref:GDYXXLXY domain-containing protein n=1 Tax=Rhizobium sp. BK376 TaxID=2512149 RepID=UPI00105321BC|nr:GDYXXLXY domain-containing protein [Rhizobium sp. BK376]TCR92616.1 putative membrane-anchored protein [Rhizobium sp. BK376]
MSFLTDLGVTLDASRRRRAWIAAVVMAALQTIVIGYVIESRASILESGSEVLLKTAPVDPRDLLRGDYVTLNYDISRVPASTVVGGMPTEAGEKTLWVRLQKQGDGFWGIAESSFSPLQSKPDTVLIESLPFNYYPVEADQSFQVDYGIERFYVPEGKGHDIETVRTDGRVSVAARISGGGEAQIRTLMIDGKPVYEEPLY